MALAVFGGGPPPSAATLAALAAGGALLLLVARALLSFVTGVLRHRRIPVPAPPESSLLLGHAGTLLVDTSPLKMAKWVREYGPIIKVRIMNDTIVMLTDAAAITRLNRLPGIYKPNLYRAFDLPSARNPSLFSDAGSPYQKAVRAAIAPCFSVSSLKRTFPWLQRLCQLAVAELAAEGPRGPVDVSDLAARLTSDTIGDVLLSKDLGAMTPQRSGAQEGGAGDATDYIALVRQLLLAVHAKMNDPFYSLRRLTAKGRAHEAAFAAWDSVMDSIARDVLKTTPPEYTLAGHLLRVVDPTTGKPLTLDKLKGELSNLYIAGFETTSHAITWTLGLLAAHPQQQDALAAELARVGLAPSDVHPEPRPFEWGDLSRLPLLNATIKESLRLFAPAAGGSLRALPCDTEILGYTVPKGTMVSQPLFSLGRATRNYGQDVDEFKPERWISGGGDDGAAADGDKPKAELPDPLPFSVGPRDCVGRALAMLELQAVLATLVGRFSFALPPGVEGEGVAVLEAMVCYHITLHARNGMPLLVTPREA